ncbi:MAG: MopE-related protein, partial [Candidatus Diapherotrites archaeon]
CDNKDNDCDGKTDDELTKQCGSNVGICKYGISTCNKGMWGSCIGGINPATEICDNLDNDCDGKTDETLTKQCGSNVGICKYGISTCNKGIWGVCVGGIESVVEICDDGKDNDCDSTIDEGCTENPENNLAVIWFSNAMKKILKTQAVEKANIAKISAAKNEYESFQIIVSSKIATSKNFTVSVSNFSGIIDAYKEEYVDTGYVPNWGIDQTELIYSSEKLMPDPLVPITLGKSQIQLKGNKNQPIWFTIYVPKNAPAGTYAVMIEIKFDSGEIITKKVTLEVYDFELPDEFALRSLFGFGSVRYHFKSPSFTDTYADTYNKMVKKYYELFKRNRLNPFLYAGAFSPMITNRNTYFQYLNIIYNGKTNPNSINYNYFENAAQQNLAKFNTFIFTTDKVDDKTYFPKYGTSEEESSFKFFFTQVWNYLKNKGWSNKAVHYLWDEPHANEINNIKKYAEWIKDASVAPDLPTAITLIPGTWGWASITCPSSNLYDDKTADFFEQMFTLNNQKKLVDIWIPVISTLNSETKQLFKERPSNETLWTYDVATFSVITRRIMFKEELYSWYSLEGKEGVANRIWPWLTWKFGGTGIVYYSVNAYECQNNPWKNPTHVCGGIPLEQGTGAFFYPPCKESATGSCKEIRDDTTIIPSIRWELLREGTEDYEYFNLLQKKIDAGKDIAGTGKLAMDNAMGLLKNDCWYEFDTNPSNYYSTRDTIARAIVNLK